MIKRALLHNIMLDLNTIGWNFVTFGITIFTVIVIMTVKWFSSASSLPSLEKTLKSNEAVVYYAFVISVWLVFIGNVLIIKSYFN